MINWVISVAPGANVTVAPFTSAPKSTLIVPPFNDRMKNSNLTDTSTLIGFIPTVMNGILNRIVEYANCRPLPSPVNPWL